MFVREVYIKVADQLTISFSGRELDYEDKSILKGKMRIANNGRD